MTKKTRYAVFGAGGFIGNHIVARLVEEGAEVRAVDKKPLGDWFRLFPEAENLVLDLREYENCVKACKDIDIVIQLAADMGGIGFIENERIACLRNVLINTHVAEAAYRCGVGKLFYSSSACIYNTALQADRNKEVFLKESDAYPAMAERGYGWEKLFSEMIYQEYAAAGHMKTYIGRFFNIYGPWGSWNDGREKAPAALCRKIATVAKYDIEPRIEIWGDGTQIRNFTWIDDLVEAVMRILDCDALVGTPVNVGYSGSVTIKQLADMIADIAELPYIQYDYIPTACQGVGNRNTDNSFIKSILGWEPTIGLNFGLPILYDWIYERV